MKRLDEIEARANAATEGPWAAFDYYGGPARVLAQDGFGVAEDCRDDADAEFIAHARQDVPDMVAALRAVVAVHRPETVPGEVFGTWGEAKKCEDCEQRWPCNTLDAIRRVIEEHLGGDG